MTSTEQPDQQEYGMAKASTSQQQGPSHKVEDEKLSGGRVLVVSSLDGKDGLKGGKNGRRRGRFIILVDEGEERRRWLPWMLLVLLIIGVGIAIFFIVRAMKREEEESTSRNSSLRRPDQGKIERFSSCGDGDESPLITRLRDTAKQTTILHYEMHDIIVPTTQDARVYESDEDDIAVAPLYYTVSGSQLMVLKAQQNASAVINRLDFSTIPAFQSQKRLTLTNETSTVPIDTGLATFVARQIFQPSSGLDVLLVIGSAVGAAPVIRGTPNIVVGEPNTPRSPSYTHPTLRPFDTTVIILVNIEQPENPVVHSVSEHEGRFVTATEEQESWAWVFIRASAHVSADHDVEDDSQLDDTIMPVFRYIPHRSASSELEPWQSVGDCTDVNQLELASKRDQPSYMLVAQPVNINIFSGGGFVQGESVENKPELFVMGWSSQMQPVLPAKVTDSEDTSLLLFLTEAIAAGSQSTTSGTTAPSSTTSTVPIESAETLTALMRFSLTGGRWNYSDYVTKGGDTGFQGAMDYLPEKQELSLLLTDRLDDSSDSLRNAFYIYNTTPEFQQKYNKTDQFRDRAPTSIVYLSDEEGFAAAFVGFAFESQPLVQVLPRVQSETMDCDPTTSDCARSVQRLFVKEQVSLMKGITLNIEESKDSKPASLLLVAGRKNPDSTGVGTPASSPAPGGALTAATEPTRELQFSLYSYRVDDPSMEHLSTATIAPGRVLSEAFQDARAAWLFHAPSTEDNSLFFALPVNIVPDTAGLSADLLTELNCTRTNRGATCGRGFTQRHEETVVKRMRFFGEGADLHFTSISNCHVVSVLWSTIIDAIPPLPQAPAGNATQAELTAAAGGGGVFKKVMVESQQFSAQCGQHHDPTALS